MPGLDSMTPAQLRAAGAQSAPNSYVSGTVVGPLNPSYRDQSSVAQSVGTGVRPRLINEGMYAKLGYGPLGDSWKIGSGQVRTRESPLSAPISESVASNPANWYPGAYFDTEGETAYTNSNNLGVMHTITNKKLDLLADVPNLVQDLFPEFANIQEYSANQYNSLSTQLKEISAFDADLVQQGIDREKREKYEASRGSFGSTGNMTEDEKDKRSEESLYNFNPLFKAPAVPTPAQVSSYGIQSAPSPYTV